MKVFKRSFDILMLLFLASSAVGLVWASTWTQVTQFSGSGTQSYTTDYFVVAHAEWRIVWSYTPSSQYPSSAFFGANIYNKEGDTWVDVITGSGSTTTSGTTSMHNKQGTFYLKLNIANTQGYTITIEQDVDSVPEFGTLGMMMLGIVLAGSLIIAARKRKGLSEKQP